MAAGTIPGTMATDGPITTPRGIVIPTTGTTMDGVVTTVAAAMLPTTVTQARSVTDASVAMVPQALPTDVRTAILPAPLVAIT